MLERGELPLKYFLVGDDAYPNTDQLLTPYSGEQTPHSPEDTYNFYQSSTRIRIECAFGRLVQRFGILWRPLRCKLKFAAPVVFACMILHNLCFNNVGIETNHADSCAEHISISHCNVPTQRQFASVPDGAGASPQVWDQELCYRKDDEANRYARASVRLSNRERNIRRDDLADNLQNYWGVRRPKGSTRYT